MKTRIAFALFVLSIVVAGAQEKKLAAKLVPPLESHGQPITNYGCTRDYVQDTVHGSSTWMLTVWAEYGKDGKKYWSKIYGTYDIPHKNAEHNDGSTSHMSVIYGKYTFDFTVLNKACAEWEAQIQKADASKGKP
jgi:hypothetical protein